MGLSIQKSKINFQRVIEGCVRLMIKFCEALIDDFSARQRRCDTSPIWLRKRLRNQTRRGLVVKTKDKKEYPSLFKLVAFVLRFRFVKLL